MEKGRESDSGGARAGEVEGQVPRLLFRRSAGGGSRLLMPVNYYLSPFSLYNHCGRFFQSLAKLAGIRSHTCETDMQASLGVCHCRDGEGQTLYNKKHSPPQDGKTRGGGSLCLFYSIFLATEFSLSRLFILWKPSMVENGIMVLLVDPRVGIVFWDKILPLDGLPREGQSFSPGMLTIMGWKKCKQCKDRSNCLR